MLTPRISLVGLSRVLCHDTLLLLSVYQSVQTSTPFVVNVTRQKRIGQWVKLLLAFARTVIPGFSLLEVHDQDFCSLLDMYAFRSGASSSTKEGVGLSM
jgi:hypothetical protein